MEPIEKHEDAKCQEDKATARGVKIFAEFWHFMRANKKWWLAPIIAVFIIFGVLLFFSSAGVAPFIYTLF